MSEKMKKVLTILIIVLVMSIALFSLGIGYKGGVRGVGWWESCSSLLSGLL